MNPVKTLCFTISLVALLAASAAAQTIYFYPPEDAKWIAGRSYISQGTAATAVPLDLEASATKCGWYKASIPSSSPLRNFAQFWLGKPGIDRIGPNGKLIADFDSSTAAFDDINTGGGVFRLGDIFAHFNNPPNLYVVADELDANDQWAGWYTTDPSTDPLYNDQSRCEFELAAFIYDTDGSVHPDFSCGRYSMGASEGNGTNTYAECQRFSGTGSQGYNGAKANLKPLCTGVFKGLAKQTLNSTTRKIECAENNGCTKNGCWTDSSWFRKAFEQTPGVNIRRCYDMPFTQVKTGTAAGSFEFDSDKMLNANGKLVGGFFPEILHNAPNDPSCPNCNAKRDADRFPPLIKAITPQMFDAYEVQAETDFSDGDHPPRSAFLGGSSNESIYDWSARDTAAWYLHGTTAIKNEYGSNTTYSTASVANEHFCFESHADFYYDPSQEFYFSGDDPIWVYINNKLVIDLGGNHMAAPGHVKLNTLGLTEGNLYPIDIFFCDGRTANSNVRITTNMYVVQKSAFTQDPENTINTMCAAISEGASCESKLNTGNNKSGEMCGPDLIAGNYVVDFYMVNRVTKDTVYLSPARNGQTRYPQCVGDVNGFKCNGDNGIVVNNATYKCGGKGKCRGDAEATAKVGIQGSYNVYARLMTKDGKPVPGAKVLLIDSFKGESNDRIIWGTAKSQNDENKVLILKNAYDGNSVQRQDVVAGKWIPVYISTGSWASENAFEFDDEDVAGHAYKLTVSGGSGLTISKTKGGSTIGTTSATGTLPASGVDTLWVKGDYDIGDKEFSLNVVAESAASPSMIITIKQPRLEFRADATENAAPATPSGWAKWGTGNPPKPPVVGKDLDVYIVAIDPVTGKICDQCSFTLRERSEPVGSCKADIQKTIVKADNLKIVNGKLNTNIRGQDDTGAEVCTATWKIFGESDETSVQWTGLRFRESPVPIPLDNTIWDRNGDGIGDKVVIKFNKSLTSKGDSLLPVLLEVNWDGTPHYFYLEGYGTVEQLKNSDHVKTLYTNASYLSANAAWWKANGLNTTDSVTITIEKENGADAKFSKDILTAGTGKVSAWIPYIDAECTDPPCTVNNAFTYGGSQNDLKDRIPPIVVKAEYVYGKNKGGCEDGTGCTENFTVYLSERVFPGPDGADNSGGLVSNPFSYCLGFSKDSDCPKTKISDADRYSQGYNNTNWEWELPRAESFATSATYRPSRELNSISVAGDSIVDLIYLAKKLEGGGTTRSPKPNDWVKLRGDAEVFQDAEGNIFNPRERGVLVTGVNPSKEKPIYISQVKPNGPSIGGTFANPDDPDARHRGDPYFPDWISDPALNYARENLFQPGNVTEFLPVDYGISNLDTIKRYYPSSVGPFFEVAGNLQAEVNNLIGQTAEDGGARIWVPKDGNWNNKDASNLEPLNGDNAGKYITLRASVYYHTNVGDYTAHRNPIAAKCTDQIFMKSKEDNPREGEGDCFTNRYNFYLAWDLKANSGRTVGAGAYVEVSKFWIELSYFEKDGVNLPKRTKKLNEREAVQMRGVKRIGTIGKKPSEQPEPIDPEPKKFVGYKRSK